MKNARKHILLSFAVLMMTMTACGQVNDDKTESRKSSASSNVDSSSSESDSSLSSLSDSSKSDSKTTTTTAATKATSSVTTTSIVTVTDAKGNLLSKISIDENGKVINLDKDGKPKTTTKKTTNKTGSTSSSGTATTTRKTTTGGGSSTSYTFNSGSNNNSGGYSNGNSGSYDNSYSNDNNNSGNSGNSNSGNSGNNNSSSNNNQQQQTEQQTQAPEPEPEPVVWDGYTLDWWLQSDFRSKDDYINIGRGLSNDGSDLSKAKAVYKYMLTTYKSEHPDVNCISYASATYALCKGIGLDCRYIMYSDWYNHVSTAVYVDDGWYNMDTNCASNSGWSENEIRLFENNKNGMDYTQICDEYENYGNISCLSKSNYFEYCEKINGYTCIYPLSEDEAVEYHRTGKLPQHVLDDIEFDKQTL